MAARPMIAKGTNFCLLISNLISFSHTHVYAPELYVILNSRGLSHNWEDGSRGETGEKTVWGCGGKVSCV